MQDALPLQDGVPLNDYSPPPEPYVPTLVPALMCGALCRVELSKACGLCPMPARAV